MIKIFKLFTLLFINSEYILELKQNYPLTIYSNEKGERMKGGSHVIDISFDYVKNRHKIVCLIGSSEFKDTFLEVTKYYMNLGYIVLSRFFYKEDIDSFLPKDRKDLISMYKKYIDLADEIVVINVDNYIDNSTLDLIDYVISSKEKSICYLSKMLEKQQIELSSINAEKKDKK